MAAPRQSIPMQTATRPQAFDYRAAVGGSRPPRIVNAMTVDVEEHFQVSAFERHVARDQWSRFESRVCRNTERLLELFDEAGVKASFFVLGWVAERQPGLVRQIVAAGHELASHGYAHQLVYDLTPQEFRDDIRRSKAILEDVGGQIVRGYRAPSFSITRRSLWAFDVLAAEGYEYDASVFPIHHDRYGIPDAPRHPYLVTHQQGRMPEFPASTFRLAGQNLPIGGGGYFRMLPYVWTSRGMRHVNEHEGKAVMFYLHPWEIDPGQPRIKASLVSTVRHYSNLAKTESRLRRLLSDFSFGPAISVLSSAVPDLAPAAPVERTH